MIIDTLANAHKYYSLNPGFEKGFEFIKNLGTSTPEPGKFPIDGPELHASVSLKDGVKREEAKFEAHNNYIDIQYCPEGTEEIGWSPREKVQNPTADYNAEKDVTFFKDAPDMYFCLKEGQFAIFYPEDVHAPMIAEGPVRKVVVKVKC